MSDWEMFEQEPEDEQPRRLGIITWLILFLLVCSLLFPLISPLLRRMQYEYRSIPTPTRPLQVA